MMGADDPVIKANITGIRGKKMIEAILLLDTGSAGCFVNKKLIPKIDKVKILGRDDREFMTANRGKLDISGRVLLNVEFSGCKFVVMAYVVDDLAVDLILGRDFFRKMGVKLWFPGDLKVANLEVDAVNDALLKKEKSSDDRRGARARDGRCGSGEGDAPTGMPLDMNGYPVPVHSPGLKTEACKIASRDVDEGDAKDMGGSSHKCKDSVVDNKIYAVNELMHGEVVLEVYEEPDIEEMGVSKNDLQAIKDARLLKLLERYPEVTSSQLSDLPCIVDEHRIDLNADAKPYKRSYYRVGLKERQFIEEELKKLLDLGIIEHSRSPWGSPVVLVKKKDGSFRMCIDFRQLNSMTKPETYPLPYLEDIIDRIQGCVVFTKLDLKSGYWQIMMRADDQAKTAFVTHTGAYQWRRMPFGLRNATSTFQRIMRKVLAGLEHFCEVHVDDILIFSQSEEKHLEHLKLVLDRLKEANFILNLPKCEFMVDELVFVGHKFSKSGISPDPAKLKAIHEMAALKDVSGVRTFLGMMNYYRRFIKNFAELASPLTKLTCKSVTFNWGEDQQNAFDELKKRLLATPILFHPDFAKPFKITTDASNIAVGGVLSQDDDEKKELPISFYSRKLNGAQLNYGTIEKECLAIVECVKTWRQYLGHRKFTIETDHKPLTWLHSLTDMSRRQARWAILLQEYDYDIVYRAGKTNVVSDALSRLHDTVNDIEENAEPKEDWTLFENALIRFVRAGETQNMSKAWLNRIKRIAMNMSVDESGSVKHKGRMIPNREDRHEIVERSHLLGHYGITVTMNRILKDYWWPGMYDFIKEYLSNCKECNAYDDASGGRSVKTIPQHIAWTGLFDVVGVDYMGPLPETPRGNKYLLMFNCQASDFAEWFATPRNNAEETAKYYVKEIICRYYPPNFLLSDRGGEFVNDIVNSINNVAGVLRKVTSGYHPQTNGQVEKHNHILMSLLRKLCAKNPQDWDLWLPYALLCDRSRPRVATGYSPMYLMYGKEHVLFNDFRNLPEYEHDEVKCLEARLEHINKLIEIVSPELVNRAQERAREAQELLDNIEGLEPGTYVQVRRKDYSKVPKLMPRFLGLYRVVKRLSHGNYKIERLRGQMYPLPVHPDRLRPIGRELALRLLSEIPENDVGSVGDQQDEDVQNDVYEMEKIISHKITRRGMIYEIKWKGYDETTEEPESNIINGEELLREYWNSVEMSRNTRPRIGLDEAVELLQVVIPADIGFECLATARPMPSEHVQRWILANIGMINVDALPFNVKMQFCRESLTEIQEGSESKAESVWINAPFSKVEQVLNWIRVRRECKHVYLLLPEWIRNEDIKHLIKLNYEWSLPNELRPWFVWPNTEASRVNMRELGYNCRIVRGEFSN